MLLSPMAKVYRGVLSIEGRLRHKHVALGEPWVGLVNLLLDQKIPAHDNEQSEPGGWPGLTPRPGTPLLGTRVVT